MRLFVSLMGVWLLISGCATHNAFEAFEIDAKSERAITGLRTATLFEGRRVVAVLSSVYLNYVEPEQFPHEETFLIATYTEMPSIISNMRLNGYAPIHVDELASDDALLAYLPIQNDWNRYFLMVYPEQRVETLTLKPDSDQNATGAISYQKVLP